MTDTVRVYVNSRGLDVPRGATALDAVGAWDTAAALAVASGEQVVTDSRGLPADPAAAVSDGAILRTIPARSRNGSPGRG